MRDQSNSIREQVSFKQREEHIRDSWTYLCDHYQLNKSDLVKFLIKKEECFLKKPEAIPSGFFQGWLWTTTPEPWSEKSRPNSKVRSQEIVNSATTLRWSTMRWRTCMTSSRSSDWYEKPTNLHHIGPGIFQQDSGHSRGNIRSHHSKNDRRRTGGLRICQCP